MKNDETTLLLPHRRFSPLNGRSVIVSAQRGQRPWQGQQEAGTVRAGAAHDPNCHLCAGNTRTNGETNPAYTGTYVFANDFPALAAQAAETSAVDEALFRSEPAQGVCRVICYSPDHSRSLPEMSVAAITEVVATWMALSAELGATHASVQVFENKGAMMGCSAPHPHGQVWATEFVPDEVAQEDLNQRRYLEAHGRAMLLDCVDRERVAGTRCVVETEHWLAVVPFWATWPFETLLLPKFPVTRLTELLPVQATDLAVALKRLTSRYDNLFQCSFPYSMGWHGAPFDQADTGHWQLHAHFFPPLLRSATVRKFMAGFELLGEAQRDLTPEQAAERLRAVSDEVAR